MKAYDNLLHPQNFSRFSALLVIWSLTPLAVVVSVQEVAPLWAFSLRFLCAAPLAHLLLKVRGQKLPISTEALKSYVAGALGIFIAMILTYLAAVSLPSSIISMIFGLSPLVSGVIGLLIYRKQLSVSQWLGMGLGLLGLGVALGLFFDRPTFSLDALALVCIAMFLSVVSLYMVNHIQTEAHLRLPTRFRRPRFVNTMTLVRLNLMDSALIQGTQRQLKKGATRVKRSVNKLHRPQSSATIQAHNTVHKPSVANLSPLAQTVGALWVSFFGVVIMLPFLQDAPSSMPNTRALLAMGFLVGFSSLLAFVFLYELNQRISPTAISLVTILTPILATLWGALFNAEPVGTSILWGLAFIVSGLALFVWGGRV